MKDKIHPENNLVTFKCSSCGATFELLSTLKAKMFDADACSQCHSFYTNSKDSQKSKGRSDKLKDKFNTGRDAKESAPKASEIKKDKKQNNVIDSLEDLAKKIA